MLSLSLCCQEPLAIATDGAATLYVADGAPDGDRIYKLDRRDGRVSWWGTGSSETGRVRQPPGLAVDRLGNLYLADPERHRIQKFSPQGALLATFGERGAGPGQFESPQGLAADPSGNLVVADTGNQRIQKLSAAGAPLAQWGSWGDRPGQFYYPIGVALGPDGSIYVADRGLDRYEGAKAPRVQKLTPDGEPLRQAPLELWDDSGPIPRAVGLAVAPRGSVYVAYSYYPFLMELTPELRVVERWGRGGSGSGASTPGEFQRVSGLAVAADGAVFVSDAVTVSVQELRLDD